jgi:hypothetical protein
MATWSAGSPTDVTDAAAWSSSTAAATVDVHGLVTQRSIIDALEAQYPMLRGTIRDYSTNRRRPFLRFFACEEDRSFEGPDAPLPDAVAAGTEPFMIVGALSGG